MLVYSILLIKIFFCDVCGHGWHLAVCIDVIEIVANDLSFKHERVIDEDHGMDCGCLTGREIGQP